VPEAAPAGDARAPVVAVLVVERALRLAELLLQPLDAAP
jgi:hypothetical protein